MSDQHTLTVLVIPGCPNTTPALDLAHQARAASKTTLVIEAVEIHHQGQAADLGFTGSPSFHLDGHDLFPTTTPPAITCRLYNTPSGLRGTPDLHDLTQALDAAVRQGP
ncbi:MAG: hypothetical protein K0R97_694 [Oerskovia sp.]|jgi:hypothetical protein|nr:hypothetical protein [Oerskovia sp.]